mgnify:CR=1 FL=1
MLLFEIRDDDRQKFGERLFLRSEPFFLFAIIEGQQKFGQAFVVRFRLGRAARSRSTARICPDLSVSGLLLRALLPFPLVVFLVLHDVKNVDPLPPVIHPRNQPILVACDVEHRPPSNLIGTAEVHTELREVPPHRFPRGNEPVRQRRRGIGVFLAELRQGPLRYHSHPQSLRYVN